MKWLVLFALALTPLKAQDLKGHSAPVRALVMKDPNTLLSGSFDQSIIEWDLTKNIAKHIYKKHEGAVNAIIYNGQIISAGDDASMILWGENKVTKNHDAAISSLTIRNGKIAASSWDANITIDTRLYKNHKAPVSAVRFYDDNSLISIDHNGELHHWRQDNLEIISKQKHQTPAHALYVTNNKKIILGQANGELLISQPNAFNFTPHPLFATPIIAIAMNEEETLLAAAALGGTVVILDMKTNKKLFALEGVGLPVWSVIFNKDEIITGGQDGQIRRWDITTGEQKGVITPKGNLNNKDEFKGERGAEIYRACAFCHSLKEGEERAGPNLYKIINRKSGAAKGYNYSNAISQVNIIWTKENLTQLFKIGPSNFIKGNKMPDQYITNSADMADLLYFLERHGGGVN